MTNQNSDQSKFKLTLTNQNLNSLSMWRVYNSTSHNRVYILSCKHASRPIRARVLSLFYTKCYVFLWHLCQISSFCGDVWAFVCVSLFQPSYVTSLVSCIHKLIRRRLFCRGVNVEVGI